MEYPFVTVTDAGADLLASTNGDPNNSLVIDKAVFSNQKSNTNKPLEQLTPSDFANPLVYQITTVKHHQNTIQPEVTLDNKNFQQNYPIYMIGILAHAENDNSGNETLYAVEEASNDPMIMPKATDNDFNCTFGIPIGISRSQDVNIVTTEAGTVSDKDFKEYKDSMDSQLASSAANQVADSSSLTNLSQSASYNSSNVANLSNSVNVISDGVYDLNGVMSGIILQNSTNSSDVATIKGNLSNYATTSSVDGVSDNASTASSQAVDNSSAINSVINTSLYDGETLNGHWSNYPLKTLVSANSSEIDSVMYSLSSKAKNGSSSVDDSSLSSRVNKLSESNSANATNISALEEANNSDVTNPELNSVINNSLYSGITVGGKTTNYPLKDLIASNSSAIGSLSNYSNDINELNDFKHMVGSEAVHDNSVIGSLTESGGPISQISQNSSAISKNTSAIEANSQMIEELAPQDISPLKGLSGQLIPQLFVNSNETIHLGNGNGNNCYVFNTPIQIDNDGIYPNFHITFNSHHLYHIYEISDDGQNNGYSHSFIKIIDYATGDIYFCGGGKYDKSLTNVQWYHIKATPMN